MLKIGLSIGEDVLNLNKLTSIKEAGIDSIEISYSNYQNYEDFDFKKAKENADMSNIEIWSMHLPFCPFDIIDPSSNGEMSKFTFNTFIELIKKGTSIGIDKFIVHPSGEPYKDEERAERLKNSANFFGELAEKVDNYGAILAIENLPRTCIGNCSDDIINILNANDKLRVCFDTNHLLGENNVDFINKIGSKIITLHVSDYDFLNERHWLPGEGNNDWKSIYNALIENGYNGVWLYELGLLPPKTINRRELTYKDFYNNAMEIMSDKTPIAIGQRVEGLNSWKK